MAYIFVVQGSGLAPEKAHTAKPSLSTEVASVDIKL